MLIGAPSRDSSGIQLEFIGFFVNHDAHVHLFGYRSNALGDSPNGVGEDTGHRLAP